MDLEVLRKAPLFTNLDDEVFAILTSELTEVELSRGASAFHEGDQGDQLYVIMSGKIKLGRTASDGRENLVAVLGQLEATRNWYRIGREWWFGEPPSTELGRLERDFWEQGG